MAVFSIHQAHKEYKCSKCGAIIAPGEMVYRVTGPNINPRELCDKCRPLRSRPVTSEYLEWLYNLQDHLEEKYNLRIPKSKYEIYKELWRQKESLDSDYSVLPKRVQKSEIGQLMYQRIENVSYAIFCVISLDYPEPEDFKDSEHPEEDYETALQEYIEDLRDIIEDIE